MNESPTLTALRKINGWRYSGLILSPHQHLPLKLTVGEIHAIGAALDAVYPEGEPS